MTGRRLDVLVNDQLVGHLHEENDLWQFDYAKSWMDAPDGFDLSPTLSRAAGRHADGASNRPVQWYFDNLLPEEELRSVIAKEANLSAEDAFALLAYFGAESAGSLVLRDPAQPAQAERGIKPLSLTDLNRRILNLPRASLTKDAPKRMSLAGAQHKMLVIRHGGALFEPLPGTPSTQILKPEHQGGHYPASVMNEYFTMRLAKAAGLDVPAVHRFYAPQPVYLIDRFDRILPAAGAGDSAAFANAVRRRHVVDTCQLLNKARTFKYTAAHLATLAEALTHCRARAAARMRLYRWLVFNVLVGNGDNHLKNISFLVDAGGINVAPAYDLLCTAVYDTKALGNDHARWPHTALAFSLGDAATFAGVTRAHLVAAAGALGLNEKTAIRELNRMVKAIPAEADKLIAEIAAGSVLDIAASPDPKAAGRHAAGEQRMLRAVRHIVLAEMCRQLSPGEDGI
jgi:serine/threonine-protein kinase HipA